MMTHFNWYEATTGSPIFVVLILCSIVTLGIVIERVYYYSKRRGNPDETLQRTLEKIRKGKPREAAWVCENTTHPVGAVGVEVFKKTRDSMASLEERMQIALSRQKLLLERNLNVLGTMAAIAPLIGLLGTVWGIMRAFSNMAQTGSAAPSIVAAGVAEALTTTAAGLIVAVPAIMIYNHFSRRMNVMLTIAENHARAMRTALVEQGPDGTSDPEDEHRTDKSTDTASKGKPAYAR